MGTTKGARWDGHHRGDVNGVTSLGGCGRLGVNERGDVSGWVLAGEDVNGWASTRGEM